MSVVSSYFTSRCLSCHLILQVDVCHVILFYMSVMSSYFTSRCLSCHLILQVDVCRVILFYKWMSVTSSYFTSRCLSCSKDCKIQRSITMSVPLHLLIFDFHLILQVDVCRVILFYKWMSVMSSYFTSRCLSCHLILQVDVCRVILFYK